MDKRLTRTEMFASLGFLFTLVLAVGSFFYGMKIGSDKTEAKFIEQTKHLSSGSSAIVPAYQQQDLVSFYHTVFLPYREFQSEWTSTLRKLVSKQLAAPSSALKELAGTAVQKYGEASNAAVPKTSPLLEQAQLQLMKALKLMGDAAQRSAGSADGQSGPDVAKQLEKDAFYHEGVKQANAGQLSYYGAMLKWASSVDSDIPPDYNSTELIEVSQWKKLPLAVKNVIMAAQLNARAVLAPFYPQDLTARVDAFIDSGQDGRMKIQTVQAIADLLIGTDAVRAGDFRSSQAALYGKEVLPMLPFFSEG
ncbi:hypothetical protein [Paenibacillus humicola]|uniref:hypothetical protein n=1 Tax=Paenibacillus humicola TaxID=3110540 RepID=UPI00237B016A|nr:hypothetical protein [Paenibacillus humicola]